MGMSLIPKNQRRRQEDASILAGQDIVDLRPKGFSHLLLFAVISFFVIFVSWASWADLEEVTRGNGRVIPSRQTQVVQNLEGGIVRDILVREGEIVEQGQPLMRIDDVLAASEYREKKARYYSLLAAIARLRAEVNEEAIAFPEELMAEARGIAQGEVELFNSRQEQLDTELEILRRQAEQSEQELAELETRLEQLERSYALAVEELAIIEPMAKKRVVARSDLLRLQREVNDLRGELETTRLTIPRVENAVREAHQRIANAFSTFRSEAWSELSALEGELAGIREVIVAGEDRVRRTEVRSPVRGTVKELHVYTIGGVVGAGEELVEIVPLEDTLLVEAKVRPADIAFLHPDLPATVKITAYDFSIYGGLEGWVEDISADTILDDRGEESFYRVRVRTARNYLGTEDEPLQIIPGMTAQVDIITGEKTVMAYILKPILKAQEEALRER